MKRREEVLRKLPSDLKVSGGDDDDEDGWSLQDVEWRSF